ncbi:MAG: hypothetical protein EXQ88_05885 [Alphaproteobacteria bacterium]|nr:hypothetical protein [Alphaproteobacteria bacterium]
MRILSRRKALLLAVGAGLSLPQAARAQEAAIKLAFSEMYQPGSMEFSVRMKRLDRQVVRVAGFMAPPLKPDANFFVLTSLPMATCPYCDDAGNWPDDIVFVRTLSVVRATEFDRRIAVTGTLELGAELDKDSGFVSLVRLMNAYYSRI